MDSSTRHKGPRWAGGLLGSIALLIALGAAAGEPEGSANCEGSDEVILKNGGMLRGRVVALEPEKQVVIVVCGDKRTLDWAEVDEVQRGKAAAPDEPPEQPDEPDEPEETAKPAKPSEPTAGTGADAPPPPAAGVARIHIVTDDEGVQLYRVGGGSYQIGDTAVQVGIVSEMICQAPCDTIVDGRDGASFHFAGYGIPPSDPFQLVELEGDVAVAVDAGSPGAVMGGVLMMAFGVIGLVAGAIVVPVSFGVTDPAAGEAAHIAGGVSLGGGAALTAGGAVLVGAASTETEFLTPGAGESAAGSRLTTVVRF